MALRATTRDRAVVLAIQWRGAGTYRIGRGSGNHPNRPSPLDPQGRCDCSNLVHWCLGSVLSRGSLGYFNTDGMLADSHGLKRGGGKGRANRRVFTDFEGDAEPGDLLVRPGVYEWTGGKLVRKRAGHVGIVTQVERGYSRELDFLAEGHKLLRVVHCSTFGTRVPPAIRETDARAWRRTGYLVRFKEFSDEKSRWLPA